MIDRTTQFSSRVEEHPRKLMVQELFAEIVWTEYAMAKEMYAKIKLKDEPFINLKT
jgi:hypothetical protein